MDAYLEHADWVRKLARELVRDPGTADDLVQETWLAFETARPDEQRSLRPWLARVLRNAAAMHKRRSAGRAAREEATASSERVASTGDLVARAEEQRRLAGLVLGLDEPYRKTLLLRYYEGLSPAQIAKLQGIPGATVRTHLHRGLQKLRERLDAENGGDRKAWTVLLQPLAWPKPWLLTPQASWIGVALMASVGVWWIASGGFGFERGPSSLSGTQVAAGVADPMADPAIPDPMRRIAGRSEDATTSEWNLTLVDSEQGRPLPHYRLRTASGEWESDASGLVRLPAGTASIQPINRAGLRREVEDLHGSPTEQSKTYAPTALEGQPSARQLVVPSGPTLALQADWPVDPKRVDFEARLGSPFANSEGERIWEVAPLATGDSPFGNPWVRFGHFPPPTSGPDARLQLEVRDRAGFWWGSTWIDLPTPGPEATVRVELRARGVLQGRMLVPLTALGGLARISLVGSDPAKKVIHQVDASSDGTFQCLWIEPGDYVMHVEQAGCEPWASDLHVEAGDNPWLEIPLQTRPSAGMVEGIVTSTSGSYTGQILVFLLDSEASVLDVFPTSWKVAADGARQARFRFEYAPFGPLTIRAIGLERALDFGVEPTTFEAPASNLRIEVLDAIAGVDWNLRVTDADTMDPIEVFQFDVVRPRCMPARMVHEEALADTDPASPRSESWTLQAGGMRWNRWEGASPLRGLAVDAEFTWTLQAAGFAPQSGTQSDFDRAPGKPPTLHVSLQPD